MTNEYLERQMDAWYTLAFRCMKGYYETQDFALGFTYGRVHDVDTGNTGVLRRIEYVFFSEDADLPLYLAVVVDLQRRVIHDCQALVTDGMDRVLVADLPACGVIRRLAQILVNHY